MYPSAASMNAAAVAAAARHPGPPQPGQPFKFTVIESCDRVKEEFNFLQAQYHKSMKTRFTKLRKKLKLDTKSDEMEIEDISDGLSEGGSENGIVEG